MPRLPRSTFNFNSRSYTAAVIGIFVLAVILSLSISWVISASTGSHVPGQGIQTDNDITSPSSASLSSNFNPHQNSSESIHPRVGIQLVKLGTMGLPAGMQGIFVANLLMAVVLVSIFMLALHIIAGKLAIPVENFSSFKRPNPAIFETCVNTENSAYDENQRTNDQTRIVLIANDDIDMQLVIANALVLDGLVVEYASNGHEALSKFKSCKPDLIIMAEVMPIMTGFDAAFQIKQTPAGRNTPILMITEGKNNKSIETAFKIGAIDFIPKPINSLVLRYRVKRIIEARQSEKWAERLAYIDNLTGLPNRAACTDRLVQNLAFAKRNANRLAVLFIGIDHFQDVNDNLGRAAGDTLLKFLAERVQGCVRSEDTLARVGGDEFVVVLSSVKDPKGVDTVANTLLKILSTPFHIADREIYVGVNIGISMYPEDGEDREVLMKNADTAMHRAKTLGRNNHQFYTFEMSTSISDRMEIETDLWTAQENEELILYYQPKADSDTGNILGAEVLLRWQHPRRGFLLPGEFIPIADETGVLDSIGGWVINSACGQFRDWLKFIQFEAGIAVNVSVRQLMSPRFVDNVKHWLEMAELDPEYLELEITENTLLENTKETIKKLKQLRSMGVKIAIDDFGVGYSSFSYLRQLPVNILKIDRSFVRDVADHSSSAAIIDGMIKLGHNLNLTIVAEGVENDAQRHFLRDHGCDILQGNFISEPVPPENFLNQCLANRVRSH